MSASALGPLWLDDNNDDDDDDDEELTHISDRAAHMALELGMHLKFEGSGQDQDSMQAESRKITFWSLFHYETNWAVALGRPTQLPVNAINAGKPRISYVTTLWILFLQALISGVQGRRG